MSVAKKKGPIFDPGVCRCCGTIKKCRVLTVEYESFGEKEVYADMMMDCFGLLLSHLEDVDSITERLICATCVTRLRDAFSFRKQVLLCEEGFLQLKMYNALESAASAEPKPKILEKCALEPDSQSHVVEMVKAEPEDRDELSDGDTGAADDDESAPQAGEGTKPDLDNSDSDDLPIKAVLGVQIMETEERQLEGPNLDKDWWLKRHKEKKPKLPISKVQELIREKDQTYMIDTNIISIVEFSYVCPFKCRHNNLHCYYCGLQICDPDTLRQHTLTHHPKRFKVADHKNMVKIDLTRIDCRLCPTKIDSLEDFKRHLSKHGKKYYFECKDTVLPFKLDKSEIKCALCCAVFPYFHALNKHMNEHYNNYVCETCGLGFVDRNRFLMHQTRHAQGTYPCDTCGKLFRAEYNRDLHIDRVHNKRGRVYCPKCDIRLMSHPQKLKHLVEVHGEQPASLPCTVCDKVFETRRMLTIHWRKEHLKDYRYECQVCGQKFFTRFALNNHMPTHTQERNFKCKVCEKSYPRLKTLKEHMRIHNNDRRYRCHICGQAFIQNCSLKGHMKSQHPDYG